MTFYWDTIWLFLGKKLGSKERGKWTKAWVFKWFSMVTCF